MANERGITKDWQTSKRAIQERTSFLFNNPLMSDIRFVFASPNRGKSVLHAHKLILAIGSPVFEAMFFGAMAEQDEILELPDVNSEQLLEFLRFLYCDEVWLSVANVRGVLYLAKKYIVPSLVAKCRGFLVEVLNGKNAFEMLVLARDLDEEQIEEQCWKVIDDNTESCLGSESLQSLDRGTVVKILQRDSLMASEVMLFNAFKKWASVRCLQQGLQPSISHIKDILGDTIHHFRFPLMTFEEFNQHVVPSGLLSEEETHNMLMYYTEDLSSQEELIFPRKRRFFSQEHWKKLIQGCKTCEINDTFCSVQSKNAINQELHFAVDKVVYFAGVRLFAGYKVGKAYSASLVLSTRDLCGEKNLSVQAQRRYETEREGGRNIVGFDVLLDKPVLLNKSQRYTIGISIERQETEFICKRVAFSNTDRISSSVVEISLDGLSTQILEILIIRRP